jgi:hypothetical protein
MDFAHMLIPSHASPTHTHVNPELIESFWNPPIGERLATPPLNRHLEYRNAPERTYDVGHTLYTEPTLDHNYLAPM